MQLERVSVDWIKSVNSPNMDAGGDRSRTTGQSVLRWSGGIFSTATASMKFVAAIPPFVAVLDHHKSNPFVARILYSAHFIDGAPLYITGAIIVGGAVVATMGIWGPRVANLAQMWQQ